MSAGADGPPGDAGRIATLDLLRGIAVLGILAVNIAGFAGPRVATDTPNLPHAAGPLGEAAFAFVFLVFEGKMRALFSLLFGASMLLFIDKADARGRDGDLLQLRRLGWLLAIGWLHSMLLWWGDILFVYAVAGTFALVMRRWPSGVLLAIAAVTYLGLHGWGMAGSWPAIVAEEHVRAGVASLAERNGLAGEHAATVARMRGEIAQARLGFVGMAADKLAHAPGWPVVMTLYTLGETLPLMLLGMVLLRSGFLAGHWPRARMRALAWGGIGLGGAITALLLGWLWPRHFPVATMQAVLGYWTALPHLLMALGYAAALVLTAPGLLATRIGQRLAAAGRMALTNYLMTTVAMCALFYGWGLGLYGRVSPAAQLGVVGAWWLVMLAGSAPWLARFRQGPLEWVWRSLTEGRVLPMRKP
ncbi:MAG: DUF418 domain-containing protein [Sphingomonadales bacterium]|nr:DUF418 domain-containing protein [Sphingomonadales bacterium]